MEIAEILINYGAGLNKKDEERSTPLHLGSLNKFFLVFCFQNFLFSKFFFFFVNIKASMNGHKDIIELLIYKGADVCEINVDGLTPLYWGTL